MLDNGLLVAFFNYWYHLILAFIVLRLAWLLYEKFLGIFQK